MHLRFISVALGLFVASLALSGTAAASGGTSGGGGGGGGTACDTTPVLPTVAPAADIVLRESFGPANQLRPAGGKGCLKSDAVHTGIQGFWMEYPASKNNAWLASSVGQTWKFCAASVDTNELPSPLQTNGVNGCVASEWFDAVVDHPVALMPFTAPANTYQLSMDGYPAPIAGAYVGIGFTDSTVLYSNLETAAKAWLRLKPGAALDGSTVIYELRLDGMSGPLLVTGEMTSLGFNRLALRYDPLVQTISASVNDVELGAYRLAMSAPRFVGFEGVGILDNFVVRRLQ
jgi:hypothetical protein